MNWLELFDNLTTIIKPDPEFRSKLIGSVLILLAMGILRMLVVQFINYRVEDARTRYNWRKMSVYIVGGLGVVFIGRIWLTNIQAIATFLGLLSAGVAIALQGPLTDLAGWIFILWRRPFEVGDRVEIGEFAGDVIDVRLFKFILLEIGNWVHADQSTGRILHVPNRKVFSHTIANYNKGLAYIWHEIEVMITFESNWEKAKALLEEIATRDVAHLSHDAAERVRKAAGRFFIFYRNLTPIVYLRVEANGVKLTLRYLCDPRRRRSTEQEIWIDILRAYGQTSDIEFAYPTQRFYQRQFEGKGSAAIFKTAEPDHQTASDVNSRP